MKIALIGQPNCGKSTIFNSAAGYKVATANFPGTTVQLAWSPVRLNGTVVQLVDVPGIYSLTSTNAAESAAKKFLLKESVDLIINVVDASLLSRSLELTLELRELGIPMVVCLNMMDEAARKGATVSSRRLTSLLGFPVMETIASRGVGIRELFAQVLRQLNSPPTPSEFLAWHRDIESAVAEMQLLLQTDGRQQKLPSRFLAVKLLENDEDVAWEVGPKIAPTMHRLREQLEQTHGRPAEWVIMSERHDRAMRLAEESRISARHLTVS
jgi:ferrous iron transport protein B